ncbi:MAG: hypothetical protein ACRBCK_01765 [Alphaproteobacteria bacterium]
MLILPGKIRWSFILLALFLMIISAMVSTLMIQKLDSGITEMRKQASEDGLLIQSLWQNILQDENKSHLMVMYALLAEGDSRPDANALRAAYIDFLKLGAEQELSLKTLPDVLQKRETQIFQKIERIDETYLQKQDNERAIEVLSQRKSFIMNIALFFQLFSLAVITIVRDLK